ncbi:TctA family transporter [Shinella sp. BE166]|uniref:hypothetical protein n=1 Tax=Shinella sp. BE166 TaxID=3373918 RepID=UPI003EBFFD8E
MVSFLIGNVFLLELNIPLIGLWVRLYRFEPAPQLIGFVLGPMMEEYFRRTMLLSRRDALVLLERPGLALLLAAALLLFVAALVPVSRWRAIIHRQTHGKTA